MPSNVKCPKPDSGNTRQNPQNGKTVSQTPDRGMNQPRKTTPGSKP
jgi:hypothetical protein